MNSAANMLQLQQQAAARVKQMEEQSRRLVQDHPVNIYRGVTLAPMINEVPPPPPAEPAPAPIHTEEPPADMGGLSALFGGDNEQLLLLLLAAVLAKNGAPMELLLALLYVAL